MELTINISTRKRRGATGAHKISPCLRSHIFSKFIFENIVFQFLSLFLIIFAYLRYANIFNSFEFMQLVKTSEVPG